MANPYFRFKQFTIHHDRSAMKVTTDACLFGAWCAEQLSVRNPASVLDVGAGTGLLSLMVAQKTDALIEAVEIEPQAARQAQENVAASPWPERIKVTAEDILQLPFDREYDAVICNPPFYEGDLKSPHQIANLAHHSERISLAALLQNLRRRLAENGVLYLLLPSKREAEALRRLEESGWYLHAMVHVKQTPRHQPFRIMLTAAPKPAVVVEMATLTIKGEGDAYTPSFVNLLQDYYLYL